ncbi:MAG TPA: flagellar basal body L-ring protein FlgH [Rhodobacteraceae bacterium]|nr:flagellar basal body L-ring protein FlgH [Paracoccaceae bacterium]
MKTGLLIAMVLALSGCLDRLGEVGRGPQLSAVDDGISANIAAERAAMAVAPPTPRREIYEQGSLWRSGPASLFGDRRAARMGDILTVIINIDDRATLQNSSSRTRSAGENLAISELFGVTRYIENELGTDVLDPAVGLSSGSNTSGSGTINRTEQILLRVAGTVVQELANGHLVVRGTQEVRVNGELRDLQITGIIRPEDISRQNTITYDKMAGARIYYGGRGMISDVQDPRYGQQILEILAPF